MFKRTEIDTYKLQEQLDRERQAIERARQQEELTTASAKTQHSFRMSDLYATIPGCDYGPIPMHDYRG